MPPFEHLEGFYEALLYTYIFEYSQADGLV